MGPAEAFSDIDWDINPAAHILISARSAGFDFNPGTFASPSNKNIKMK
jgi:hypothetical protein